MKEDKHRDERQRADRPPAIMQQCRVDFIGGQDPAFAPGHCNILQSFVYVGQQVVVQRFQKVLIPRNILEADKARTGVVAVRVVSDESLCIDKKGHFHLFQHLYGSG